MTGDPMTPEEIRRLVEEKLQPRPKPPSAEQLAKLAIALRRNRQAYEDPPVHVNRLPAAYVRPSALHRRPRQNRYKYALNDSQERARRERQARRDFHNAFTRIASQERARRERQARRDFHNAFTRIANRAGSPSAWGYE